MKTSFGTTSAAMLAVVIALALTVVATQAAAHSRQADKDMRCRILHYKW
jgi:hypothetical protein